MTDFGVVFGGGEDWEGVEAGSWDCEDRPAICAFGVCGGRPVCKFACDIEDCTGLSDMPPDDLDFIGRPRLRGWLPTRWSATRQVSFQLNAMHLRDNVRAEQHLAPLHYQIRSWTSTQHTIINSAIIKAQVSISFWCMSTFHTTRSRVGSYVRVIVR